jgi:uncharacterized protein YcbK (DUF882 family)
MLPPHSRRFDAPGRRDLLRLGGAAMLGLLLGPRRARAVADRGRSLSFYCLHTGEAGTVEYFAGGRYQPDGLRQIDHLLRDHYTDEVRSIDPELLDLLFVLHEGMSSRAAFHVVSGYRSPETNAWKREQGAAVARHSFHIQGQAIDVFLPGRDLRQLGRAALALGGGGVGLYQHPGFVHLDTGPVRTWGSTRPVPAAHHKRQHHHPARSAKAPPPHSRRRA